ncbi:MAG: hypothetical protein CMP44_02170 [Rickettsiales bacterium]|nr:hypothetical protein [Rickettsiales bacterium]
MSMSILIFASAFITAWAMLEVLFKVSLSFANDNNSIQNDNFIFYLRLASVFLFLSTSIFFIVNEEKLTNIISFICAI